MQQKYDRENEQTPGNGAAVSVRRVATVVGAVLAADRHVEARQSGDSVLVEEVHPLRALLARVADEVLDTGPGHEQELVVRPDVDRRYFGRGTFK